MTARKPSAATLDMVFTRDRGLCALCARVVTGERGWDWSLHHRAPRSMGGSRRPWVNLPGNLILLHGSATTGCHQKVESDRARAVEAGFLISAIGRAVASEVRINHAVHGPVFLLDDGTTSMERGAA